MPGESFSVKLSGQTELLHLKMSGQCSTVDWEEAIRCNLIHLLDGRSFLLVPCATPLRVEGVHLPLRHSRCRSLFSSTSIRPASLRILSFVTVDLVPAFAPKNSKALCNDDRRELKGGADHFY